MLRNMILLIVVTLAIVAGTSHATDNPSCLGKLERNMIKDTKSIVGSMFMQYIMKDYCGAKTKQDLIDAINCDAVIEANTQTTETTKKIRTATAPWENYVNRVCFYKDELKPACLNTSLHAECFMKFAKADYSKTCALIVDIMKCVNQNVHKCGCATTKVVVRTAIEFIMETPGITVALPNCKELMQIHDSVVCDSKDYQKFHKCGGAKAAYSILSVLMALFVVNLLAGRH